MEFSRHGRERASAPNVCPSRDVISTSFAGCRLRWKTHRKALGPMKRLGQRQVVVLRMHRRCVPPDERRSDNRQRKSKRLPTQAIWTIRIHLRPHTKDTIDMRCKTCTLVLVLVFVCLFTSQAQAQQAAWSAGFPKPGNNAGEILVQGTSTASAGWTLTGNGTATIWLKGGGSIGVQNITVNKNNGTWSGTITGLDKTGTDTYNIVISIEEANAGAKQYIAPDPGKSKAKAQ